MLLLGRQNGGRLGPSCSRPRRYCSVAETQTGPRLSLLDRYGVRQLRSAGALLCSLAGPDGGHLHHILPLVRPCDPTKSRTADWCGCVDRALEKPKAGIDPE